MMARTTKIRVYAGCIYGKDHTVIAETSKGRAAAALGITVYVFNQRMSESANATDVAIASAHPGRPLSRPIDARDGRWWFADGGAWDPWRRRPADMVVG